MFEYSENMIHQDFDPEWIIDLNELIILKKEIGRGEYGTVFLGKWRGIIVAIKTFYELDKHKIALIRNEFHAMTKLHHPNIIQLLGYTEEPFMIVMEYCSKGSLSFYLQENRWVSIYQKCLFIIDILRGLAYLHARRPAFIIHRDVKPSNFLVTKNLDVKIADFGICKILNRKNIHYKSFDHMSPEFCEGTSKVGTPYYMAPELILSKSNNTVYDHSIDIYSMGVVMYEIFENHKIFDHCLNREEFEDTIKNQHKPIFWRTPRQLRSIILKCINHDPLKRPKALVVLNFFSQFLKRKKYLYLFF
jgi:serine/threonine protein kinase